MHNLRRSLKYLSISTKSVNSSQWRPASSSSGSGEIEIPNRIKRSPTDILKALSQTVGFDPTAPHFKYHDDPYLIPMSNITKRTYALAQESGRKSAKWIRQENSELFMHQEMDPPIEAYIPTKVYTEESQVEVKDLQGLIDDAEVEDAVLVYKLLEKNKTEIPADLKQSFYEMVCFYNGEQPMDEELVEERWFRQAERLKERTRKTWKDYDVAEQIFNELEPKDSKAYSAIIRGMCKFYQVEKAWSLYNEALSNNVPLDVEVFNSILNIANLLKESAELRWDLILEILKTMKEQNVSPNLGTLNSCMNTISQSSGRNIRDYTLKILSEFKRIGVEPSLATWYFVLQVFCRERGPVSHIIIDILNQIEGKEFKIRDVRDTHFFMAAMEVCNVHIHDKLIAKRVDALLHFGDNYNLIGDSFRESVYYRHFFQVLISTETLEKFMETYNLLVPNVYTPEPSVMEGILMAVETSGAIEQIPLLWSHMVLFDHVSRENILMLLTRIMIQNKPNAEQAHLSEKFGAIAYDLYTKIEEKNEMRSKPIVWTAKLLGDLITLLSAVQNYERAAEVFDKLANNQQSILGEPDVSSMFLFVELCIAKKQISKAINCLQYCNEIGFQESKEIAKIIVKGFATLDEHTMRKLLYLVGTEVIEEAQNELQKEIEAKHKQAPESPSP